MFFRDFLGKREVFTSLLAESAELRPSSFLSSLLTLLLQ